MLWIDRMLAAGPKFQVGGLGYMYKFHIAKRASSPRHVLSSVEDTRKWLN